jgi:hypothetical protein
MNSSGIFRRFLSVGVLAVATTAAMVGHAQNNNGGMPQGGAMSGPTSTVTHYEPPNAGGYLTPDEMRTAKPFPMPSVKGPPVPQQTTPHPFAEPPGSSPPGLGGLSSNR